MVLYRKKSTVNGTTTGIGHASADTSLSSVSCRLLLSFKHLLRIHLERLCVGVVAPNTLQRHAMNSPAISIFGIFRQLPPKSGPICPLKMTCKYELGKYWLNTASFSQVDMLLSSGWLFWESTDKKECFSCKVNRCYATMDAKTGSHGAPNRARGILETARQIPLGQQSSRLQHSLLPCPCKLAAK